MDYFRRPEIFDMLFVDTNIEYVLPPSVKVEPTDEPLLMLHNGCECPCHQPERPRSKAQHAQNAQDQELFHLIADTFYGEETDFEFEDEHFDSVDEVFDILCESSGILCETSDILFESSDTESLDIGADNEDRIRNIKDENCLNAPVQGTMFSLTQRRIHEIQRAEKEAVNKRAWSVQTGVCSSGFSSLWLSPGNNARNL